MNQKYKVTKDIKKKTEFHFEDEPKIYKKLRFSFTFTGLLLLAIGIGHFIIRSINQKGMMDIRFYAWGLISGIFVIMVLSTMIKPKTKTFWLAMLVLSIPYVWMFSLPLIIVYLVVTLIVNFFRIKRVNQIYASEKLPKKIKITKQNSQKKSL